MHPRNPMGAESPTYNQLHEAGWNLFMTEMDWLLEENTNGHYAQGIESLTCWQV